MSSLSGLGNRSAMEKDYIVACCTPWFWDVWDESGLQGSWYYVRTRKELLGLDLEDLQPRYIFFPHWRYIVPKNLTDNYECICFHMTPLPYGRGGSPLQNLIARGHEETKLSVIRMVPELDAGPIYYQRDMSLLGGAEEIYLRAGRIIADRIQAMAVEEPEPVPQEGEPVCFPRRQPEESKVPADIKDMDSLFDFIRMLDAEGYPPAFMETGCFRLSFKRACRRSGAVEADVRIELIEPVDKGK